MRAPFVFSLVALATLSACSGSDDSPTPTSTPDSAVAVDTALENDTSTPEDVGSDTSATDTIVADADTAVARFDIIGTASGECGAITGAVGATGSVVVEIPLSFDSSDRWERARLSTGGKRIFDAPNAGGSSKESEVMTYELLYHCDFAELLNTETEIKYLPPPDGGKATITDMRVKIAGVNIGVNPKRVFKPEPLSMTDTQVRDQLIEDFQSINASSARVDPDYKWSKQILHVWVPSAKYHDAVKRVLPTIDEATKSNTIVLITRTTGGGFLYCDPDPALGSECPPI